ncbi:DoxX family protein [Sphingobacterium pedocola]|uniref:DoxX family protein n=1 Tax=Sphingobacterium pedocola TaxID=2082722 RepID=A0ABR9T9I1_9SPHI|nr:DoxX family protein [Sphingobacterium pedocola]MBE8722012.1 hypothetical protein [Sphingobacterium pedocola]
MIIQIIHWTAFTYYVYLFGYASLFKVFKKQSMMDGMKDLGFNESWTLLIGYAELLGVVALIIGIFHHELKNAAVIWLFLFAVGALMVHFAHHDYQYYYSSLFGCIAAVVILYTDKHFTLVL